MPNFPSIGKTTGGATSHTAACNCRVNFGSNRAYFTQLQLCALRHCPPTTFATRRRPRPTRDGARVQVHCPLRGRVWPLSSQKSQPQQPARHSSAETSNANRAKAPRRHGALPLLKVRWGDSTHKQVRATGVQLAVSQDAGTPALVWGAVARRGECAV